MDGCDKKIYSFSISVIHSWNESTWKLSNLLEFCVLLVAKQFFIRRHSGNARTGILLFSVDSALQSDIIHSPCEFQPSPLQYLSPAPLPVLQSWQAALYARQRTRTLHVMYPDIFEQCLLRLWFLHYFINLFFLMSYSICMYVMLEELVCPLSVPLLNFS